MYNSAVEAIGAVAMNAELGPFMSEGTPSGWICLEERPSVIRTMLQAAFAFRPLSSKFLNKKQAKK
jgi:hypothetical protein